MSTRHEDNISNLPVKNPYCHNSDNSHFRSSHQELFCNSIPHTQRLDYYFFQCLERQRPTSNISKIPEQNRMVKYGTWQLDVLNSK